MNNRTYQVNDLIVELKIEKDNISGTYFKSNKEDVKGAIELSKIGDVFKGTFTDFNGDKGTMILDSIDDNSFEIRWGKGLNNTNPKGTWEGKKLLTNYEKEKNITCGIYVLNNNLEVTEASDLFPEVILIGSIIENEDLDVYGFVGSVIANSCDKESCESLIYKGKEGEMIAWEIGCEAKEPYEWFDVMGKKVDEKFEVDLYDLIDSEYSGLNREIEKLKVKYLKIDEDIVMYQVSTSIVESDRLSIQFPGEAIDLEDVKKSNGEGIGEYIELGSEDYDEDFDFDFDDE